ncbi:MAG: acetyl-CoA carboxylase biotin carboxylase subunit [Alphaproteobacteria bacterium]|nr:acetyl-CoA carboxylase biotin carboxylase subunit [Alphaproteobacteria bacterium]MBL0718128.1 acetyl-CoA carboxylase biotin carboxylase subunit [Alphaproteobacteria bacterium]
MKTIKKLLIANRGEIAVRIIRACQELGIKTVAVYSTIDRDAMHVLLADESVCIGPGPSKLSYLNQGAIISSALLTGCDAVHPGYGFLSERADFVKKLEEHNIVFVGPTADMIDRMGNKIMARETVKDCGIPTVPGSKGAVESIEEVKRLGKEYGYPVLIKASAGGGGKGMVVVKNDSEAETLYPMVRKEAEELFGDSAVYVEKFLSSPRHIELQILADTHGNIVILGERDCSLQRKRQKVLEECPAACLTDKVRAEIIDTTYKALKKMDYLNAGTIEFMYENGKFYFIEMNTRIQVEHPITEVVYKIDIIKEQIRIAEGKAISVKQENLRPEGHAIELRINAENPETFIPSPGRIKLFHPAGGYGIRVDSAVYTGYNVPPTYDSMIAKLIVHAPTREECFSKSLRALNEFIVHGIETTIPLLERLLQNKDVIKLNIDNKWLEKFLDKKAVCKKRKPKKSKKSSNSKKVNKKSSKR